MNPSVNIITPASNPMPMVQSSENHVLPKVVLVAVGALVLYKGAQIGLRIVLDSITEKCSNTADILINDLYYKKTTRTDFN